jgi:hypothetical protein
MWLVLEHTQRNSIIHGMLVCWYAGMLVCWYAGMLVCWYAGMLVCWYAGMPTPTHPVVATEPPHHVCLLPPIELAAVYTHTIDAPHVKN